MFPHGEHVIAWLKGNTGWRKTAAALVRGRRMNGPPAQAGSQTGKNILKLTSQHHLELRHNCIHKCISPKWKLKCNWRIHFTWISQMDFPGVALMMIFLREVEHFFSHNDDIMILSNVSPMASAIDISRCPSSNSMSLTEGDIAWKLIQANATAIC